VRIVTLNIQHGGGNRVPRLAEYLVGLRADLVVLTEFRGTGPSLALAEELREHGLAHFARAPAEPKVNSVAVLANVPFETRPLTCLAEDQRNRILAASFPELDLFAAYFPQRHLKAPLFDFFLGRQHRGGHSRHLLIGDLNTGQHQLDEVGRTFYCADRFGALSQAGLIDLWRTRNPHVREYSWFSRAGRGFRIDHAHGSSAVVSAVERVLYDHAPRAKGVTDHSALILDLDLLAECQSG
jgi:exonuclease III